MFLGNIFLQIIKKMLTSKMECGKHMKLFNVELDENTLIICGLNSIDV